jgi:hypothetical protein
MDNVENNVNVEGKIIPAYTLRPLRDEDLWPVLGIIAEVFPDDLAKVFVNVMAGEQKLEEVGMDVGFKLFSAVIKNLPKMGQPMYDLLSNLSGIPANEIKQMPFGTTPKMILDVYKEIKNADFFGAFSKLS